MVEKFVKSSDADKYRTLGLHTLTNDEVENPILVEITDIHNKQLKFNRDNECIDELKKRARYFANCMKYKKRPSELEYVEKEF